MEINERNKKNSDSRDNDYNIYSTSSSDSKSSSGAIDTDKPAIWRDLQYLIKMYVWIVINLRNSKKIE